METVPSPPSSVLEQLERVLASDVFRTAGRSQRLLRFLVEQTVGGHAERLKEYTLGSELLGRGGSFDPRIDSIARVEASRLRSRLELYYATEGRNDPLVIVLQKGSYVPQFELRQVSIDASAAIASPVRPNHGPMVWLALCFLLGGATAVSVLVVVRRPVSRAVPSTSQPTLRLEVELGSGGELASDVGTDVVISPDGSRLVFVASDSSGVSHIHTRLMSQAEVSEMPGTDGARAPFFSWNGEWVAYWAARRLWKIPAAGGSPIELCEAPDLLGGSWGDDDNIIAALSSDHRLWRIPAEGGKPKVIASLPPGFDRLLWPQVLPGSKAMLFTAVPFDADTGSIIAFSFRDGAQRTVVKGGTFGRYLPSGHLTYINQGTLYAAPFDLERLQVHGSPAPILTDVAYSQTFGFAQFDFSQTGVVVYRRAAGRGQVVVKWIDSDGMTAPILSKPGPYLWPSLSPDGKRLALQTSDSTKPRVLIVDLKSGQQTPVNSEAKAQMSPLWTPDSQCLVIGREMLEWVKSDGSGSSKTLRLDNTSMVVPWSFAPGGKRLAYYAESPVTHFDLWTLPLESAGGQLQTGKPEPFLQTKAVETYPSFSPDGHWLAYDSDESGSFEVYVQAFPAKGKAVQISNSGGRVPRWAPQGGRLFYSANDHRVMVSNYRVKGRAFQADDPRPWSKMRLADTGVLANYDVARDGRRIVGLLPVTDPGEQQSQNHVTLLTNFFDELRRRVSIGGN
jgi:Tol biopolymer transport system component